MFSAVALVSGKLVTKILINSYCFLCGLSLGSSHLHFLHSCGPEANLGQVARCFGESC